jgi:CRISPR system Cascade subunit CasB
MKMTNPQPKDPEKPDAKAIILKWWQELQQDRGARAELRRAKTPTEVILTPAYHDLYYRMLPAGWRNQTALAVVAAVLAQVEIHDGKAPFAAQLATPSAKGSDKARVSGLRFRRLLQHRNAEELMGPLIRAVRLLEKRANVTDLAESLHWWGDRKRRDWAFAYYDKNPKAE